VNAASDLKIVRLFDAPRELVYENWTRAEHLAGWFAPYGFTMVSSSADARPGGRWKVEYRSGDGVVYVEAGEFVELAPPGKLVLTLTYLRGDSEGPRTTVTVTLRAVGGKTEMTFVQTGFDEVTRPDGFADGWAECFEKLAGQLGEHELRALFAAWSRASAARDLDASMAPIARDVVSYEHVPPLQHVGVAAVREVCKRGFDAVRGEFRWDVPDLQVRVRGDLAVTWGLNRMSSREPGGTPTEVWSRGTRVFQKIDGAWKMIHQHVSFPVEPNGQ
jgi:uncharacterized protein YndB with AHSA1/START domain